jgi:hypothetical protein
MSPKISLNHSETKAPLAYFGTHIFWAWNFPIFQRSSSLGCKRPISFLEEHPMLDLPRINHTWNMSSFVVEAHVSCMIVSWIHCSQWVSYDSIISSLPPAPNQVLNSYLFCSHVVVQVLNSYLLCSHVVVQVLDSYLFCSHVVQVPHRFSMCSQ